MPQADVMFSYFVTADTFERLERSISEQIKLGLGTSKNSFLFLDREPANMPAMLKDFFGPRVVASDPYVSLGDGRKSISFSKLRNSAIRTARASNVNWIFFCDADTVIASLDLPPDSSPYSTPEVYWQRSVGETLKDSLRIIKSEGKSAFSEGNSWFIVHRHLFEKFDFNEIYYGYGFEDLDFNVRVMAAGQSPFRCNTHVVHMHHSQSERRVDERQFLRNQAIFEAIYLAVSVGLWSDWRQLEAVEAVHPHWRSYLCFDHIRKIVFYGDAKVYAAFTSEDDRLMIHWTQWPTETFVRRGATIEFLPN